MASALKSKAVDFSKITEQIDGMIDVLGKEQTDDDTQKAFCDEEFTKSAAEKKETEDKLASLAASIEEMSATVATLKSEIETLTAEIKALDKAVAQATEQRKEEHATFLQTSAEGSAAVQLIEAAKNKLNKFYNPTMYKAPERRELTEEERIAVANGAVDPRDAEEMALCAELLERFPTHRPKDLWLGTVLPRAPQQAWHMDFGERTGTDYVTVMLPLGRPSTSLSASLTRPSKEADHDAVSTP